MRSLSRVVALVFAVAIGAFGFEAFRFMAAGPGSSDEQVVFEVPGHESFHQIADQLEKRGLVISGLKLRMLAKLTGQGSHVKRGEYALNRGMTPQEILSVLVSGKSIQYPVTFPEGSNIYEMAMLLEEKHLYTAKEFIAACRDHKLVQELLGIDVSSLEGYLFPETYNVTKYTTIKELLTRMVQNFKSVYAQLEAQNPVRAKAMSRHELVTLASIIEKETGAPQERPLIASVFYNRLAKNMKLQSDPTIIYGMWVDTGKYAQNITKEDILRPNHYNTYTVPRLPFGPISNPGREALEAVMKPATSEYFFFVSRNDGTHIFTKTYQDHTAAVKSFQLNPAARAGKSWRDLKRKGG